MIAHKKLKTNRQGATIIRYLYPQYHIPFIKHYQLKPRDIDIIHRRINGETLDSIGKSYGVSRQRIFSIFKFLNIEFVSI